MISHVMIGSNDLDRSRGFYDAAFAPLGMARRFDADTRFGYARDGSPMIVIGKPFDGKGASFGNGTMFSFVADSRDAVDAFYNAALSNGGTDEGAPGQRGSGYMAYVRDPDGNKLAAMFRG